jgi:hypothetical protein
VLCTRRRAFSLKELYQTFPCQAVIYKNGSVILLSIETVAANGVCPIFPLVSTGVLTGGTCIVRNVHVLR